MAILAGVTPLAYLAVTAVLFAAIIAADRAFGVRPRTTSGRPPQEATDRWTDLLVRIMLSAILSLVWMGFGVLTHAFLGDMGRQDNLLYHRGRTRLPVGESLQLVSGEPTAVLHDDSAPVLDCVDSIQVQDRMIAGHVLLFCRHDFAAPPDASYFLIRPGQGRTHYPSLAALEAANGGPVHLEPVRDYYFRHLYGPRDLLTILIFFVPPTLAFWTLFRRIRRFGGGAGADVRLVSMGLIILAFFATAVTLGLFAPRPHRLIIWLAALTIASHATIGLSYAALQYNVDGVVYSSTVEQDSVFWPHGFVRLNRDEKLKLEQSHQLASYWAGSDWLASCVDRVQVAGNYVLGHRQVDCLAMETNETPFAFFIKSPRASRPRFYQREADYRNAAAALGITPDLETVDDYYRRNVGIHLADFVAALFYFGLPVGNFALTAWWIWRLRREARHREEPVV